MVTGPSFHDDTYTYEYLDRRGITADTHRAFGVKTRIDPSGKPIAVGYEYPGGQTLVRTLPKKFHWDGDIDPETTGGWPVNKFSHGSAQSITITEGMDDAMAVYQMLGGYPVYACRSAGSAEKDCKIDYAYLNSFDKIYVALDNDAPGREATKKVAALFDVNKVYYVQLSPYKDPHDFLEAGKSKEFKNTWWNAKRYIPEGVVSTFEEIEKILDSAQDQPGLNWPFPTLNYVTGGIKQGRVYLVTGLEGIGKTEFLHATEFSLGREYPELKIGIIHIEEPLDENVKKKAGYFLKQPLLFNDCPVPLSTIKSTYRQWAIKDGRIHFYNHFGSDDPDTFLSMVRYLVAVEGCRVIFFDNITLLGTGRMQDDERKELDYISTKLEMQVKELKHSLIMVSHENDDGLTRGSRNISKVADVWINLKRDVRATEKAIANKQIITLNKGRGCRRAGPVGELFFDETTGVLAESDGSLPA